MVKTRFCPSPTGQMHVGNLRTALFNVLLAGKQRGDFLLRIEDTDMQRSKVAYAELLQQDLQWLGLHWQEGVAVGGELGPYAQSERTKIYDDYYQQLIDQGQAYWCFCSEASLAMHRKTQLASGKPPRYPGTCRHLSDNEIQEKIALAEQDNQHQKPSLRFRMADNGDIGFDDLVKGPQRFQAADIGDFIIKKSDGSSSFMFCNAIDDALMKVTHALRGEDHLTNTPRQIAICQALNLTPPQYGHIALITGNDGSPLSKRNGSQSVNALREQGFLPAAITNYLARLGHTYRDDDLMSLPELSEKFAMDNCAKSPAKFDLSQLIYWQKSALAALEDQAFIDWARPNLPDWIDDNKHQALLALIRPNVVLAADVVLWSRALLSDVLDFDEKCHEILAQAGSEFFALCYAAFSQHHEYAEALAKIKSDSGKTGKQLFLPLRLALTAQHGGPDLVNVVELMGNAQVLKRFKDVMNDGNSSVGS